MGRNSSILLPKVGEEIFGYTFSGFFNEAYKQFNANTRFPMYRQTVCVSVGPGLLLSCITY